MQILILFCTRNYILTEVLYMCNGISFHLIEAVTYKTMHFVCHNLNNMAAEKGLAKVKKLSGLLPLQHAEMIH